LFDYATGRGLHVDVLCHTVLRNISNGVARVSAEECRANIKYASLSAVEVEVQCECLCTGQTGATHMQVIHIVLLAPKSASAATAAASPDQECPAHGCKSNVYNPSLQRLPSLHTNILRKSAVTPQPVDDAMTQCMQH
jgi:hypothetical protein